MSKIHFIILNYLFVMSYLFTTGQNKVYPLKKNWSSQNSKNSVANTVNLLLLIQEVKRKEADFNSSNRTPKTRLFCY